MNREDIVCACLGITYGEIEDAVKDGGLTYEELEERTGVGTICGLCVDSVKEMLEGLL